MLVAEELLDVPLGHVGLLGRQTEDAVELAHEVGEARHVVVEDAEVAAETPTPKIALRHYLMTTEDHFARTSGAAQKAAQQNREMPKMACNGYRGEGEKPAFQGIARVCTNLHNSLVGRAGVEPATPRFSAACSTA